MEKYIFVTGEVVGGLGKGITAYLIGVLLKASGLNFFMQKFNPYLNVDPGTKKNESLFLINMVKFL